MCSRRIVALASVITLCAGLPSQAAIGGPRGVSPGSPGSFVEIAGSCPTFSWTAAKDAPGYELVVYRVEDPGEMGDWNLQSQALRLEIQGNALSWTPAVTECFTPGQSYAWSVRSLDEGVEGGWSEARLFRITETPSAAEIGAAVKLIQEFVFSGDPEAIAEVLRATTASSASARPQTSDRAQLAISPDSSSPEQAAALAGSAAIRGQQTDPTGVTYGVAGSSSSPLGAGLAAENTVGGADLLLSGDPPAEVSESGIKRNSNSALTFNIQNSGTGAMTMQVDGKPVFTVDNDGEGSGLDADFLDGSDLAEIMPTGAVLFFDLASCPSGWSELATAQGRAIVGRPTGGTLGGTVGAALGNLENRVHLHNVNPAGITSGAGGSHSHSADPPNTSSSSVGDHQHTVDPPNASSTSDTHNHQWTQYNNGGWVAYNASGQGELLTNWGNGIGNEGEGWEPFAVYDGHPFASYFTLSDSHNHTLNITAFLSAAAGGHNHALNIGPFSTSTIASHTHVVDVPATSSSGASTSQVLAYVQLLVCRKD